MTTPPWGHKPPPVADVYTYWLDPPPKPSARADYWVRRFNDRTWRPNKYVLRECDQCRAGMLGIYVWEAQHTMAPLFAQYEAERAA